ncbi:hypothetical protein Ddye_026650 [Dipteronia dyeriana]|uniref:Reverse transcriptase domain-containing protein n=1 Tax=Dipteronia dyeriana TaxID=168575 RepID=A0AAD9TMM9_9ROSI|nr:hypothetical protein Ddye_026650 [Dipteronia dyeriana]
MMKETLKGWKDCKAVGSKGFLLFSKSKAAKLTLKSWLNSKKCSSLNLKELEVKLGAIDDKAETGGWKDSLRKERHRLRENLWKSLKRDEQFWRQKSSARTGRFQLEFYQRSLGEIQDDFMNFIHEFHNGGSIIRELNRAFIALIPKVDKPKKLKDYRPICLVSALYKVLAKVLVNILRKIMDVVIEETQMEFVSNRQLTDSFMITEEIINKWKGDKEGGLLVKLDFEKAYDSVDHGFLYHLLEDNPQFGMEKGLRQGDPISPFLFNIVVEGLNVLLQRSRHLGQIEEVANRLERLQMDFLWGDRELERKLHAVNWKDVCKRKDKGGLGIGRILQKNKAFLVKWIWRFGKEDKALWRKVICSKYKVDDKSLFWNWQGSSSASFFVKSMKTFKGGLSEMFCSCDQEMWSDSGVWKLGWDKNIYDIRELLNSAGNIKIMFESRRFNSFADSLARMGSSRSGDFVEWGDF